MTCDQESNTSATLPRPAAVSPPPKPRPFLTVLSSWLARLILVAIVLFIAHLIYVFGQTHLHLNVLTLPQQASLASGAIALAGVVTFSPFLVIVLLTGHRGKQDSGESMKRHLRAIGRTQNRPADAMRPASPR